MPIVKRKHNSSFTILGNDTLNDDRLKADALGVLVYLRSKPADWELMVGQLAARFSCGKDKMYRIIRELMETGYIKRYSLSGGGFEYHVYDEPEAADQATDIPTAEIIDFEARHEKPDREKPDRDFPDLLQRTDLLPNTEINKEPKDIRKAASPKVTRAEADDFFENRFWPFVRDELRRGKGCNNPKEPCRKKVVAAVLSGENPEAIMAGAKRLAHGLTLRNKIGTEFVPMAVTWVNNKGWKDDPDMPVGDQSSPPRNIGTAGQPPGLFATAAAIRARHGQ